MKALIIYLAEVTLISGLLCGYYHFFLRNKKFHGYNRYFLLAIPALSLALPLLNFPIYFKNVRIQASENIVTPVFATGAYTEPRGDNLIAETGPLISTGDIFLAVYVLVGFLNFLRLCLSLRKIRHIIRTHTVERFSGLNFIRCEVPGTPFSFFNWLFWNKNIRIDSAHGEQMFRHEWYHIRQKHSYDVMLMELLTFIFWINPFFYLVKKELRTIHEFLSDRFAIGASERSQYAELLLMQALQTNIKLAHPFFHNQIKRRIAMITNSGTTGAQYFRKLMVLPLSALLFLIFSFSYRSNTGIKLSPPEPVVVMIDPGHGAGTGARDGQLVEDDLVLTLAKKIRKKSEGTRITIVLTREKDSNPPLAERKVLAERAKANLFISLHIAAGRQADGLTVYVPSKRKSDQSNSLAASLINKFRSVHKTQDSLKQSAMSIFVLEQLTIPSVLLELGNISHGKDKSFLSDESNLDKLADAILEAIVSYTLVGSVEIKPGANTAPQPQVPAKGISHSDIKEVQREPIYVIDGKIDTSVHAWNVETRFPKESIESVNILKGAAAIEKYGSAASGGAIEIKLKWGNIGNQDFSNGLPTISVNNLRSASVHNLLKLEPGTEIISYKFTIDLPNGDIAQIGGTGDKFNSATRELIVNARPGRLITIDLITIRVDGKEKKVPSKIYQVVE